jgi:Mor family transcriptional regulator
MLDAKNKGRTKGGKRKLTWTDAAMIRMLAAQGMRHATIARQYEVSQSVIFMIVNNRTWKEAKK